MSALDQVAVYPQNDWAGPNDKGKPWLDRAFFQAVIRLAEDIQQNPANLIMVWCSESIWCRPWLPIKEVQPGTVSGGLSQLIIGDPAERERYKALSAAEQVATKITDQYHNYVRAGLKPNALAQELYAWNAAPGRMQESGSAPDTVLYRENEGAWKGVSVLDTNRDGVLTIPDLASWLLGIQKAGRYQLIQEALNEVAKDMGKGPYWGDLGPGPIAPVLPQRKAPLSNMQARAGESSTTTGGKVAVGGLAALLLLFAVAGKK